MSTIGTFTQTKDGGFTGRVRVLGLKETVVFKPETAGDNDKAPDYRVFIDDTVDVGAAWKKTAKSGNDYMSVKLESPLFATALYASLVLGDDKSFNLIWSRGNGKPAS
ncbi:hypothetical protein BZG35_08460 [Brevundimonas sp. LM2]|uniref:DUF736 domain-containing protein n=1 Tax=Brevundimonas sp. LM2 TaxID=1938605 RepID=UPI000983E0EC|nr:DUF736 domain-containing protein [Brevundimonas sp. LM2]AQR61679.1 hypothetical protein BZG35_08460 [Brevundimonas sp. LM2]